MTLNNVISRIKSIALAHKQIRNFYQGLVTDFLTDKTTKFPSCFVQDNGGVISTSGHATTLAYRMFLLDLVHLSEDSKQNEQDVQSDMLSVAMDIIAQMNLNTFTDWRLSADNNIQLVVENDNDMVAGVIVDFSVRIIFKQDVCAIPTDAFNHSPIDGTDKPVFDTTYVATGLEGNTLLIPIIQGKKILFITRENNPIFRVNANPDSAEYSWDNNQITLGTVANFGERFLILYRNY